MSVIQKDFIKINNYKIDIEKNNNSYNIIINDVISWDYIRLNMTEDEIKNLGYFIQNFTKENV